MEVRRRVAGASPALAKRYAEALYDVLEEGQQEEALEVLRAVAAAWRQSRELRRFVAAPMVPVEVRVAALAEAIGRGIGHPLDMLLAMVLERRRLELLELLADSFEAVMEEHQGRRRVIVYTAVELSEAELERVRELAERVAGGAVKLEVRIDPEVIGGVRLQCGDTVIDATLRGYLTQLAHQLAATPVVGEAS